MAGGNTMYKVAAVLWVMAGTVLAGAAITALLSVPSLADQLASLIPIAAIAGYGIAIPLSVFVAKRIGAGTRAQA
jgi:hypothetical protein